MTDKIKKNLRIIMIILILCILAISLIRNVPSGTTKMKMPNSSITLEIPKHSNFIDECCMYSASFESIRSVKSLQKELDNIMLQYQKKTCDGKIYYYNSEEDITIHEYGVTSKLFKNTFYLVYDLGDKCSLDAEIKYNIDNNYDFKKAKVDGYVVFDNTLEVANFPKLDEFLETTKNNINGNITIVLYTIEGDPVVYQFHYKDGVYTQFHDSTRDKYSSDKDRVIREKTVSETEVIEFFDMISSY